MSSFFFLLYKLKKNKKISQVCVSKFLTDAVSLKGYKSLPIKYVIIVYDWWLILNFYLLNPSLLFIFLHMISAPSRVFHL